MARVKPKPYDTIDALIEAMQDEAAMLDSDADGGALTSREIAQRMGVSNDRVMIMLRRLHEEGRLEAMKVYRPQIDGAIRRVAAYRVRA